MAFADLVQAIHPLSEKAIAQLAEICQEVSFPKGHLLLTHERIENQLYFIQKGIVRAFHAAPNQEVTFWFGQEGDVVLSIQSYVQQKASYEQIEVLEPTILYRLEQAELQLLYENDVELANWGRKLAEKEWLKAEKRLIDRQCKSASERYEELVETQPELLQRVNLGHIASYLGMTQVSLSRIRAEGRMRF